MFDTVILNGRIVYPGREVAPGNIGIKDGKIAAITECDADLKGRQIIDATGKYVFPGVIEPHSHIGIGAGADDLITETGSAAVGGVTTVLFFLRENVPYDEPYMRIKALGEERAYIDFSFHIVLITEDHLADIPKYVEDFGVTSFKLYMTYRGQDARTTNFGGNPIQFPGIDDGYVMDGFRSIARYPRAIALIHAENIEMINRRRKQLQAEGRNDVEAWALSRPPIAEVDSVRRVLKLAQETECRVNILHLTTEAALREVETFRNEYPHVWVEVCHPYLVLNEEAATSKVFKLRPPLRTKKDNDALWAALKRGKVDTVGSDHVPRKLADKMGDIFSPAAGAPGTPFLFPILLSEGYHKHGLPLTEIARLLSLNPARLYGLYPRKGDICIGADADLVIVDLDREHVLKASGTNQFSDFILYEDWKVKGYPEVTLVRGQVVASNGKIAGQSGWGKYISR